MRSLLEVMKSVVYARIADVHDDKLWYRVACADSVAVRPEWTLMVPIPLEDLRGGTFLSSMDERESRVLQRWIRKELARQKEEQEMIAEAKAAHDREVAERGGR